MIQHGHDLDQEEPRSYRHTHVGSPITNSPPGTYIQQFLVLHFILYVCSFFFERICVCL
jgi:hypothetical protein